MSAASQAEWTAGHFILRRIAGCYGLTVNELLADDRTYPLVEWRQIAMYLCRQHTALSYKDLGVLFRRDHTTVIHGVQTIAASHLARLKTEVQQIDEMITAALSAARGSVPA